MRYDKPWLSLDQQIALLESRGLAFPDRDSCLEVLQAVGYYRLSGYLHPFRRSEPHADQTGRIRRRVLSGYRAGTTLAQASALIDFDRRLRLVTLEGVERLEIALRMRLGYALGRRSPFAHLDASTFVASFTEPIEQLSDGSIVSNHSRWLEHVRRRQAASDETFVQHFRDAYDGEMPIWALTEILELGQLGRLFSGLERGLASEIAAAYGVPTKKMLTSWISSLNHVRNLSAHHARLFNRKLVTAPARPSRLQIPLLGHLKDETSAKEVMGVYNVLAIMAYLLRSVDPRGDWSSSVRDLMLAFPVSQHVDVRSMGVPERWAEERIWGADRPGDTLPA